MSTTEPSRIETEADWAAVAASPEFQDLRRRLRRFVMPLTVAFLAWYLVYVLLASYAPAVLSVKIVGNVTTGLVLGLLQFVSTFVITALYVRYAGRRLDPLAAMIREDVEGGRAA